MPVSPEYRDWVLEQLRAFGPVSARAMFGGAGLYHDGLCFGLLAGDVLYFKGDEVNRPDFEARAMPKFEPYGDGRSMNYWVVPADALEDPDALAVWARGALDAARRAKSKKKKS